MAALSSPMQFSKRSTRQMMLLVLLAASPAIAVHSWFFGIGMLLNILLAMAFGMAAETLALSLRGHPLRRNLADNSVLVIALLFGIALPPGSPWWLLLTGITFAVLIGKHAFGGLGQNLFNPAMTGYLFLLLAFPVEMSSWHLPHTAINPAAETSPLQLASLLQSFQLLLSAPGLADGLAMATPLLESNSAMSSAVMTALEQNQNLFARTSQTGWELVNWAFLLGGVLLLAMRIISWHIPVAVIATLLLLSSVYYSPDNVSAVGTPYLQLFGGATMVGAFFIATDPVTAATSNPAKIVYGILIGCIIFSLRVWGAYPDSIAIAVLFANFCAPMLDHYFRPRVFGRSKAGSR